MSKYLRLAQRADPSSAYARRTCDPRPDHAGDTAHWETILTAAYELDGQLPSGVFAGLHGLRCMGAGLTKESSGRWRIVAGEMDAAEYLESRKVLTPHIDAVRSLLAEL
jgi:hypothetical protein